MYLIQARYRFKGYVRHGEVCLWFDRDAWFEGIVKTRAEQAMVLPSSFSTYAASHTPEVLIGYIYMNMQMEIDGQPGFAKLKAGRT